MKLDVYNILSTLFLQLNILSLAGIKKKWSLSLTILC
jgi:hypothetical protein